MDHQAFAQLVGNYGEFLGAIAVVVTLFYVATQLRHSADATKAVVRQGLDANISAYMSAAIDPGTLQQARIKQEQGELLDKLESATLFWHNMMDFKNMEGAFRHHQMGLLGDPDWVATEHIIRMKLEFDPIARSLWEPADPRIDTTKMFAADFRERVLKLLNETNANALHGD